ncbi:uncharacterized protein LOC121867439 [Homarus americanus]|uniref:uncharacterized protein LOC121867439 n=1 Tax=Homarus americanus TaxID=6706 RepID=UPI001C488085|nr:uncharacterized protein LOC121867439 [Homarus americanus]
MSASVTLLVLSLFIAGTAAQVGVRGIYLTKGGERQQYLNLGLGDLHYQLECDIEADPKDVVNVTWSFENWGVVYVWTHATGSVTVNLPLKEHVETPGEGKEVGSDIQFVSPQASMRGVYTCSVYHNREDLHLNPVSSQYELQMYAFFEDGYKIAASVEECTVYWNFSTPRMYPRPTVHCGFWNTSTGVLVKEVRGGLVFHQDPNYLWYVYAHNTPIQVEDIPRDTHFHCTTEVAIANYTRQTDLTDTAASHQVYEKVNDRGCPVLPVLRPHMDVRDDGCLTNCRGECHPFDDQPVLW